MQSAKYAHVSATECWILLEETMPQIGPTPILKLWRLTFGDVCCQHTQSTARIIVFILGWDGPWTSLVVGISCTLQLGSYHVENHKLLHLRSWEYTTSCCNNFQLHYHHLKSNLPTALLSFLTTIPTTQITLASQFPKHICHTRIMIWCCMVCIKDLHSQ